jgi:hypothetical protein
VGSSAPGSFGAGSLVSAGGSGATYRFTPTIPATWDYNVYIWWPSDSSLAAIVPVTIVSSDSFGGEVRTRVDVDQRTGGGAWHALGHFRFPSGAAGYVEISDENGRAAADAVWFAPVPPMP